MLYYYPITLDFVELVIARRPKADVAIPYPSKVEAVPAPKRLTMMPTVSIVTGYYGHLAQSSFAERLRQWDAEVSHIWLRLGGDKESCEFLVLSVELWYRGEE